jgi:sortase A
VSRAARILSTALITAGLVVLLDVGMTLAWKEPVSSVYGWWQQRQLSDDLDELEARYPTAADLAAIRGIPLSAERAAILARRFHKQIHEGEAIGRFKAKRLNDLSVVMVEGTDTASLQTGPGHYPDTPLPGQRGTVGVAGHRTTYLAPFRHINDFKYGDLVLIEMPYATFHFHVQGHRIVDPGDVGIVRKVGYDRLVLTACHPLYSAAKRYAVFLKLTEIDLPAKVRAVP